MKHVQEKFEVSERDACRVVGQHRSIHRREPVVRDDEAALVKRMLELVREHPRFGYRRICRLLRREEFVVNMKRTYRLWRREELKVRRRTKKSGVALAKAKVGECVPKVSGCVRVTGTVLRPSGTRSAGSGEPRHGP